jgi:hypothetical protein
LFFHTFLGRKLLAYPSQMSVSNAAPRRPLPLIVLSADRPWGPQIPSLVTAGTLPADVPPDFGCVTDAAQKQAQEKLAKLVPNARHITNTNSGHEIQKEQRRCHIVERRTRKFCVQNIFTRLRLPRATCS